jgi:hypothetical protein
MDLKVVPAIALVATICVATFTAWCGLYRSVGNLEGELKTLSSRFAEFDRLERTNNRLDDRLRDLEKSAASLGSSASSIARQQETLAALRKQQQEAQAILDTLRKRLAPDSGEPLPPGFFLDVTSRLRRLEDKIDAVSEKLGVAKTGT